MTCLRDLCHGRRVQKPHVRVTIGDPRDQPVDLVILPGRRERDVSEHVVMLKAPHWRPPSGPELALAEVYRHAVDVASRRGARSVAMPAALVIGSWPMEDVTRVAMTVLMSTPSTVRDVLVAAPTAAALELWAEALAREP